MRFFAILKPLSIAFFALFIGAAQAELPPEVANELKKVGIPQENVAVFVQAVEADAPSWQHNADKSMNPASVMKLVTANAALDLLGADFRWKTELYQDGIIANGELMGNLVLKGYGDPTFSEAEFRRLLVSLRQTGIKKISGDLLLDKSYFAKTVGARRMFDDETWRAYNAEPSALLVNGRNTSFRFSVRDGQVQINQEAELPEIKIDNKMQLKTGGCGEWRNHFGYNVQDENISFSGKFSADCGERYLELSLVDDEKYAFYFFKKLWRELGGEFAGQYKNITNLPAAAQLLVKQQSQSLSYMLRDMNKWSHNLMARQLLLTIAAEKQGAPATEKKGELAIQKWLSNKQINAEKLVIENGSGLSRVERTSATQLGQMLIAAFKSPNMPELMASLSIAGVDGTAKKRLASSEMQGRAHLKTGSLNGVSAIAGYVLDLQQKRHVVVMLVNHANAASSKNAQDALLLSIQH